RDQATVDSIGRHEHPESSATSGSQFDRRRHAVRPDRRQRPYNFRPGHSGPKEFPGPDPLVILIAMRTAGVRGFLAPLPHSPPELGGVPSRSEGGAVCSKTNSTGLIKMRCAGIYKDASRKQPEILAKRSLLIGTVRL